MTFAPHVNGTSTPDDPFHGVPPEMQAMLDDAGLHWAQDVHGHIERVIESYSRLVPPREVREAGLLVTRDVVYGPHPRHRLDVFRPLGAQAASALIFVHGGAFVRGDKTVNDALYDNLCCWFAQRGVVAINAEYRLAGDAPFPGGASDVGAAVRHVVSQAASWGIDPTRIFLMGHSAGGTHVAGYCCDPELQAAYALAPVAGAVMVSARLRADVSPDNPNAAAVRAYFGPDEQVQALHSPVTHARAFRTTAMVVIAEHENPHLDAYGAEMMSGLLSGRPQRPHRFLQLLRHNHLSVVAHFFTGEEGLGKEVLEFMFRADQYNQRRKEFP